MTNISKLAAGLAAWAVTLVGADGSALAQDADAAAAAPPGVIAAFITAGTPDPNGKVPAINAVAGAGVSTLSVATPLAILLHGRIYTYLLASQNITFNGKCTDAYVLHRGSTILAHAPIHSYSCGPGSVWEWAINGKAIPNSPGLATLTGTVTFGGKKVSISTSVLIK